MTLLSGPHVPILTVTLNPALDVSSTAESVHPGEKLRLEPPQLDPGGGGVNIARVVQNLGGRACAAVALGGPSGVRLGALLDQAGIAMLPLPGPGDTRESLSVIDRGTGEQYRFVMPGPEWQEKDVEATLERIAASLPAGGWVAISGSNPPGIPDDFVVRLAALVREAGAHLLADTSGHALRQLVEAPANIAILRMNREEAEFLAGHPLPERSDTVALLQDLITQGVAETVVLARGADGNILGNRAGIWHAKAVQVETISAVGAGDSFAAGLILGHARGGDWPDILALAAACATATRMTPATELCRPEDVRDVLAKGQITRLNG